MSKEIVKASSNELVFGEVNEDAAALMEQDAEEYFDDTAQEDIALPRLRILQSGSKQLKKSEPDYIKEAEEGDLFNTLTQEFTAGDIGVYFVPVKRRVVYLEWRDIDAGGGLVNNFGEDPTEYLKYPADEKGAHKTGPDTEIVKTLDTFGYLVDSKNGTFSEVLLSMAKTQIKKMKKFNALIRSLTGKNGKMLPEYAGVYKLTTVPEKNDVNSWFNYDIKFVGHTVSIPDIGMSIYNAAKDFRKMIEDDKVQVKYEQDAAETAEETEVDSTEPM